MIKGYSGMSRLIRFHAFLSAAFLALLFNACTGPGRISQKRLQAIRKPIADTLVVVRTPRSLMKLPQYRLSFGDVIEIKVFNHPEFNETTSIRPDGRIALEKIGELFVLGLTPAQLDSILTRRYSRFIRRPDVTVLLRQFGERHVYVLGEVNAPGGYLLKDGMTVLRAIAEAGGQTQFAKMNSVILLRNEYYREPVAIRLDLSNFTSKPDRARDQLVMANDIIFIPRTFIGELDGFVDRFFSRLIEPPLDLYLRTIFFTRTLRR